MKKRAILLALVCVCAGALTSVALATPSTLIWIPSTDIQAPKTTHVGTDVYAPSSGSALTDYGLTFGTGKIEYGIDELSMSGGVDDPVRFNAKLSLKEETTSSPKWVIGAFDYGSGAASNMIYVLGSKTLPAARLTFGYCSGKKSALGADNNMILLGVDKTFNSKWWGAIDYQGGKSAFGALNAGIAYTFSPTTSLIAGYDWYNNRALADTLTLQLDVNL